MGHINHLWDMLVKILNLARGLLDIRMALCSLMLPWVAFLSITFEILC